MGDVNAPLETIVPVHKKTWPGCEDQLSIEVDCYFLEFGEDYLL